ncbi:MAG: 2,3-bisphosphoglycerate-independent phosphoglycerate mutase [Candidatus Babeliaceae bacterium]
MTTRPKALIILDGFGYRADPDYNAIYQAHPKNFNQWLKEYPWTILQAAGESVGLLPGMMGNSAAGHFTIGVGRIIKQPVTRITESIEDGSFFKDKLLIDHFKQVQKNKSTLHLMGLLSDAGVHSLEQHLYALLRMAAQHAISDIVVHPFLDGRDVPPRSAALYLEKLEYVLQEIGCGIIGSLHGRFYAMDRDGNWDRTLQSYQVLLHSATEPKTWQAVLETAYQKNLTDEFIQPISLLLGTAIKKNDAVIYFNIRADRSRQLPALLMNYSDLAHLRFISHEQQVTIKREKAPALIWIITGIEYYSGFTCPVLCQQPLIKDTLLEYFNEHKKRIFTIAETEKYAHITYFFNGGRETSYPYETCVLVPSLDLKNYAESPYMSAPLITYKLLESFENDIHDFYLVNYANADMVGHSGNFTATVQAIACLDEQLKKIYEVFVKKYGGILYITGDHGNAEEKYDYKNNQIKKSHNTNPVYFLCIDALNKNQKLSLHQLADIAPFIKR